MVIAAGVAAAAVVSAGATAYSASRQADAAENAANVQGRAADASAQLQFRASQNALRFQHEIYRQQRVDSAPYRRIGRRALGQLANQTLTPGGFLNETFGADDFRADPGYQFRIAEGQRAIDRSAAARGNLLSGGTLRAGARYASDLASQEYGNAFNRFQTERTNRFNRLASIAGIGQTATQQQAQAGQNFAGNAANILQTGAAGQANALQAGANAQASGYIGASNAQAAGIQGVVNTGNQAFQNYLLLSSLNQQR